jgi:hypothetical protein
MSAYSNAWIVRIVGIFLCQATITGSVAGQVIPRQCRLLFYGLGLDVNIHKILAGVSTR